MARKEENKILDDKIESNVNQYKVDRLNAEISAFSSGDLNKYEFLKRINLNYKPNALDKARFEFSPLGKTFSTGLDKTAQGFQEEGVIKLLKDIRDGLAGGIVPKAPRPPEIPGGLDLDRPDDGNDSDDNNMPDLETEEEAALNKFNEIFRDKENEYNEIFKDKENEYNEKFKNKENRLNKLNNNVKKLKNKIIAIKHKLDYTENERNDLFLDCNQLYNELKETKNELNKSGNDELKEKVDYQENRIKKLESELNEKDKDINILKNNIKN